MRRPILVINDDPLLCSLLSTTLGEAGFEVRTAGDGVDGMRTLVDQAPCWVLLDLAMPVMDGFEFLSALRRVPFPPRVFVASDVADSGSVGRALRLGAEHAFTPEQIRHPRFGSALREALGLPAVDPVLDDRHAA